MTNDHSASRRVDVLREEAPHLIAPDTARIAELREMTDNQLRTLIAVEREQERAHGKIAEAARLLLALRTGEPTS